MPRGYARKHNLTKDTLLNIATTGILIVAASTSPFFLHRIVSAYFEDKNKKKIRARAKKLRELEKKKLISFIELGDGQVKIELTQYGKKVVRSYNIDDIRLKKPEIWDGKWRILIYDIPSSQRKASNAFRQKVRSLGLFPLQKSVWVSPYECLAEIEFLATVFNISIDDTICYLIVKDIPREKEIKSFFNIH